MGGLDGASSLCGAENYTALIMNGTGSILPYPFEDNQPIQVYDYYNNRIGKTYEPSILLNSSSITGYDFPIASSGGIYIGVQYHIGSPYLSCNGWTNSSLDAETVLYDPSPPEDIIRTAPCDNFGPILCIRPYIAPPTPTPTTTTTTTTTTPTPTPTTTTPTPTATTTTTTTTPTPNPSPSSTPAPTPTPTSTPTSSPTPTPTTAPSMQYDSIYVIVLAAVAFLVVLAVSAYIVFLN